MISADGKWAIFHVVAFGGGALLCTVFALYTLRRVGPLAATADAGGARTFARWTARSALFTWVATVAGTYIVLRPVSGVATGWRITRRDRTIVPEEFHSV